MHVGKTKQNYKCTPVFLDNWTSKETKNIQTGKSELTETYRGKVKIEDVSEVKYLGSRVNSEGTNMIDIKEKCNRGVITIQKIQTILDTMYFGRYFLRYEKL